MTDRQDTKRTQERQLADRFARMRAEDRADPPPFPTAGELATREPAVGSDRGGRAWKISAVAAGVAAVALLLVYQAPRDPGEVYVDIMAANAMATDQLLMVSPGVLPEMAELPGVYEIEFSLEQSEMFN